MGFAIFDLQPDVTTAADSGRILRHLPGRSDWRRLRPVSVVPFAAGQALLLECLMVERQGTLDSHRRPGPLALLHWPW